MESVVSMKCKNCESYRQRECKHPSLNISGIFRRPDDKCDLTLMRAIDPNKGQVRKGFVSMKGRN